MSDTIDLQLLGKMVARMQAGVEDVRRDYASVRASLTTMDTRFAEFGLRLSSLELAQMKLAASFDDAHTKLDRVERDVEVMKADLADVKAALGGVKAELADVKAGLGGVKADVAGVKADLGGLKADLAAVDERQISMDGKLDRILARLADR